MTSSSAAAFDVLTLTSRLSGGYSEIAISELHSLAYFACLLSMLEGYGPSWWRYAFTRTKVGAPYAEDLSRAVDLLIGGGRLNATQNGVQQTEAGAADQIAFAAFPSLSPRTPFLVGSADSSLAMSLPRVIDALASDPELSRSGNASPSRHLLEETGLALVQPHLEGLRQAMGGIPQSGSFLPAVVWLEFLAQSKR